MDNEISKAIKRKTDAQMRMNATDITPVVNEGVGNTTIINDPSKYIIPMVAGQNVTIGTSGSNKVINALMNILAGDNITVTEPDENGAVTVSANIGGKPIDLTGLADGYVLTYDVTSDSFILAELPDTLSQATELELGGIRAKSRTTENAEVAIDGATGKLYAPESGGSYTLPQAGETTLGGVMAKAKTDETVEVAIDETTGKLFVPSAAGGSDLVLFSAGGSTVEDFTDPENLKFNLSLGSWAIYTQENGADGSLGIAKTSITFMQTKDMTLTTNYDDSVTLKFYIRGSGVTETTFSAIVLVNGVIKYQKAASFAWELVEIDLPPGANNITFRAKDTNYYGGTYTVAVDKITLPSGGSYGMEAVANNPGTLLATNDAGSAIVLIPKSDFLKTPESEGTAGQVLVTDGTGGRSWGDIVHPTPMVNTGATLPTADISYRGQIFTVLGDVGVADTSHICQKDATDAYVWTPI